MATEVWRWQGGTSSKDELQGVSVGPNGSCTLVGSTRGNWSETNAGSTDWVAVNLDVNGTLRWEWQNATSMGEQFLAAATGGDGSVVMVGYAGFGPLPFAAVKLDADGGQLWEWKAQDRGLYTSAIHAVTMAGDGGVVWAGSAFGVWSEDSAGSGDFTASKMDVNGTFVWKWQNGTSEPERMHAAAVGDDETVVLGGYTYGNWTEPHGNSSDADFAAVKLDADGNELWRWQNGTTAADLLYGAANGEDGSVVLAGSTEGAWNGPHAGGINDFAAVKLDADGEEVWRWQDGTSEDDVIKGVAPGGDGSVVMAGHTKGAWNGSNDGSNDFAAVKLDANGTVVWRWQGSSSESESDEAVAIAAGLNGLVVIAGNTGGASWVGQNDDQIGNFVAVMLDTNAVATPSPTAVFPPAADAVSPTLNPSGISSSSKSTSGMSPLATSFEVSSSPAPLDTMPTPTPGLFSLAPSHSTSTSASYFSLTMVGTFAAVATAALIIAGVCLRKTHQEKKHIDDEQDREVPATVRGAEETNAETSATSSASGLSASSGGCGIAQAALEAASHLAQNSQFPGVSEAAILVSTLVHLISNDRGRIVEADARLKRCRLLVTTLERAATVLGKIDSIDDTDLSRGTKSMLVENVQDAIGDMVGLIQTYKSRGRIAQVTVSMLFKRRMEEMEAVINQTFTDLMRWLQIDNVLHQGESRENLANDRSKPTGATRSRRWTTESAAVGPHLPQNATEEESSVSSRRLRRQRNLDQIEIPEDHVQISEDILGEGGFGTVYIADYNGRNAAAKVIEVDLRHDQRGVQDRRAFLLLELQTMIRLRSPYTVNVYGAITSRKDRVVLVMELLTGGDLRSLLTGSQEHLPEAQARRIIRDVCAGMTFLHCKNTIHGDLKSANVLLDAEGRAKIGDFGTSRLAQHRDSTGLATYKPTEGNSGNMLSFAWAAPEVLDMKGSSYASDVYSFGIVAWEVLSLQVPWTDEVTSLDIYKRVVFLGERPKMAEDAPADIASVVQACWVGAPESRPTFSEVMGRLKSGNLTV